MGSLRTVLCIFLLAAVAQGQKFWGNKPLVTDHDLNMAVKVAQDFVSRLQRLERSLDGSDIDVQEDTPSHGQLIESLPTAEALNFGRNSLVANRASLYLVQRYCQKMKLATVDCVRVISKWSVNATPLKEKCAAQFATVRCQGSNPYRSYDGSCNHLLHPSWGQTFTGYRRLLPALYADGIFQPRRSVSKKPLPSARYVSNLLIPDLDKPATDTTLALVQWTEFISNDMYHTPVSRMVHTGNSIECCRQDGRGLSPRYIHPTCQQIDIPVQDPDYSPYATTCMNYVRSLTTLGHGCNFGPADQMNQASHYLDGSMVYGSTAAKAISLRSMVGGLLATSSKDKEQYLVMTEAPENHCQVPGNDSACFKSGDSRVNQHPHHTAMYTLWMREHNRVAQVLTRLNPQWEDERLYQEARRIVVAEMQHVTYSAWTRAVLGVSYVAGSELLTKEDGFSNAFNEDEDPSVSNSFATVGLRFVSSMMQSELRLFNEDRGINSTLLLKDHFFKPAVVQEPGMLENLLRGLTAQISQRLDTSIVEAMTSLLFRGDNPVGQDVFSLDIQRGRDHGLPSYNHFRKFCNLPTSDQFDTFLDTIPKQTVGKLQTLYNHPDDVDLIVGVMSEVPSEDGLLGKTLRCIVGEQMVRTKKGDRFFYDLAGRPHSFKPAQLTEIKKVSLARILCDNTEGIQQMQADVFKTSSVNNPLMSCSSSGIPTVNLKLWEESM